MIVAEVLKKFYGQPSDNGHYFQHGQEASIVRRNLNNNCALEIISDWGDTYGSWEFKAVNISKEEEFIAAVPFAMKNFEKEFSEEAKLTIEQVQKACRFLGVKCLVNKYFTQVESPSDGNLVLYHSINDVVHGGIFRTDAVDRAVVESKWRSGILEAHGTHLVTHPLFFIPERYGNRVTFYRFDHKKKNLPSPLSKVTWKRLDDGSYLQNKQLEFRTKDEDLLANKEIVCLPEYDDFNGNCDAYASLQTLVLNGYYSPIPQIPLLDDDCLGQHFQPVKELAEGDLAVYYDDQGYIQHYGIVRTPELIESKWGQTGVYVHPPFHVPEEYGNRIRFFRNVI